MTSQLIDSSSKEHADSVLAKYYEKKFISPEKKTYLAKHESNIGPYLAIDSGENNTKYLLDAASQIATLGLGFAAPPLMGTFHHKASWTNNPNLISFKHASHRFQEFLKRKLDWCHLDATYCNSGAEANEIALGYAFKRRPNKNAKKVLAFEGSFHGRMMISLSSTWNKSKREPFQWPGYETVFTDYPEIDDHQVYVELPKDWLITWDQSTKKDFSIPSSWSKDDMTHKECDALLKVREQFKSGDIFAVVIEPMQCEGGDRYSTNRFHNALLLMARSFGIAVIHDEVQTGFHLGTSFFWHKLFKMKDINGLDLPPDYVVCAKKAQVGLVLSPRPLRKDELEQAEQFSCSSVIRGFFHGLALDQSRAQIYELQESAREKLNVLVKKHSKHLARPRAIGMAFAIDLLDETKVNEYIAKRFNYGLLYYPAGSKTLRFRLNTAFTAEEIDYLFKSLDAITDEIFNGGSHQEIPLPIKADKNESLDLWQNTILALRADSKSFNEEEILNILNASTPKELQAFLITKDNFKDFKEAIISLEESTYEKTRQTDIAHFEKCVQSKHGICIGLKKSNQLVAITFSSSLRDHDLERGLRLDPSIKDEKSLYVIDTTVEETYRGHGVGRFLKASLTALAISRGYHNIKGRNRDQMAAPMFRTNLSLGALEENYLIEDYPDHEEYRNVLYYGIPLTWDKSANLSNRLNSDVSSSDLTIDFLTSEKSFLLNKICLSNFVSERFLSHMHELSQKLPQNLRHCYSASGQSECVDKVAKSVLYHKKESLTKKSKMITFKDHYFGNGSFLSRSLSDSSNNKEHQYFPVAHLDTPREKNSKEILSQLKTMIECGEAFCVWLEPVMQKTFEHTPKDFIRDAIKLCRENNVPLIFNETAAASYTYSDESFFASNEFKDGPHGGFSFLGGQAGIVFLEEELFVEKPLMMISTWDGDEYALGAFVHSLRKLDENKQELLKIRSKFHDTMKKELDGLEGVCYTLNKGKGMVAGQIPTHLKNLLSQNHGHYFIDPSFEAMKDYLVSL